jgi:hypothetical protein
MSVDNFAKVVKNDFGRLGQVIFLDEAGTGWVTVGRTKNVEVTLESVDSEKDSTGRILTLSFDIKGSFDLMQTSPTELANLSALASPDDVAYPNGFTIFLTEKPHDVSALTIDAPTSAPQEAAANIPGIGFINVLLQVGTSMNFMGEGSFIPVTFEARVFREAFDNFVTNPMITFDI